MSIRNVITGLFQQRRNEGGTAPRLALPISEITKRGPTILFDSTKLASYPRVSAMNVGDSGYIEGVYSRNGRSYIHDYWHVHQQPEGAYTVFVKRVSDGFIVVHNNIGRNNLWITDGDSLKTNILRLIPVVDIQEHA